MAILAMCFDLMQEELVAKFRWIGRKIGIVEKDEEENPLDKRSDSKMSKKDSLTNDDNANRTIMDNNNDDEWPTQRTSSGTRKLSPRNNISRVHPMETGTSNDGNLHQRVASGKQN
jgi:plasmid rolling circle replication initiator protein Rep